MGRVPKASHLKSIEGGRDRPERRRVPVVDTPEPENPLGDPPSSAKLTPREKEVWGLVVRELPPGMLKAVDQFVLVALCRAVALQDEAAEKLRATSLLLKSPKGMVYQSPYVGIINTQAKQIKALGAELGLSPAARTRISMGDAGDENDPTAKYFA